MSRANSKRIMADLAGSFAGIVAGGAMFHHKVSKPEFWPNVGLTAFMRVIVPVLFFPPALP